MYPVIAVPAITDSVEDESVKAGSAKQEEELATGTTLLG